MTKTKTAPRRGNPRTNTERKARHKSIYGNTNAPEVRKGQNRR